MSDDFLARWSRLKRESAAEPAHRSAPTTTDSASPPLDLPPVPAIDVSSLPAIESIDADSSVAAFLQAGVPDELTRAALRSAWASDPAIRDFVGIAENQWDFNGKGTIAGFGSLSAEEYARAVAARVLGPEGSPVAPEVKNADERESSGGGGPCNSPEGPSVPDASASPPQSRPVAPPPAGQSEAVPAKRTHGSALPK